MKEREKEKLPVNRISGKKSLLTAFIVLFILTIAMFYDVLFTQKDILLSSQSNDLYGFFMPFIKFGFDEIKKGNLPLWNPHNFSGLPFFGNFQSALLYPINFLHLILPFPVSINFLVVIHVFLGGIFMYLWTSKRGLHFLASLLSAILFMFSAPYFLHIYAGHTTLVYAATWIPLIFLSVDSFLETSSPKWIFMGIFAVSMQIFSGFPQLVFFTFITVLLYSAFNLIKKKQKLFTCVAILCMYGGGASISAVQLLTGLDAAKETVRSGGVSFEFATNYSLPPENFITLLTPGFFGDMINLPYWGRWYLWETCLFISITGLVLALYSVIFSREKKQRYALYIIIILFIFALGKYTPLYQLVYYYLPFFNKFRSPAKLIMPACTLLIMLSATGFDILLRKEAVNKRFNLFILISGILTLILAIIIKYLSSLRSPNSFSHFINLISFSKNSVTGTALNNFYDFCFTAGNFAFKSLIISSLTILGLSIIFYSLRFSKKMIYCVFILAVIEIFFFARTSRVTFDLQKTDLPEMTRIAHSVPENTRIIDPSKSNLSMVSGFNQMWGYEPLINKRYAEFISFINSDEADELFWYFPSVKYHINPLYGLIRCKYMLMYGGDRLSVKRLTGVKPLKRLELIQDYELIQERDQIFSFMEDASFDPEKMVILEESPLIEPVKSEKKGWAEIVKGGTDYLIIEAEVPANTLLLVTDAYSKGWKATPIEGSSQEKYHVMPANYILRAIPLSKGYHRILLEYSPRAFHVGKWISIISLIIYLLLLTIYYRRTLFRTLFKRFKNK